jgi:hypothetical protein
MFMVNEDIRRRAQYLMIVQADDIEISEETIDDVFKQILN